MLDSIREQISDVAKAINSCRFTCNFDVRDWSQNSGDAWLYGIIVGWDDALESVATKHRWSDGEVARLRSLRANMARLEAEYGDAR